MIRGPSAPYLSISSSSSSNDAIGILIPRMIIVLGQSAITEAWQKKGTDTRDTVSILSAGGPAMRTPICAERPSGVGYLHRRGVGGIGSSGMPKFSEDQIEKLKNESPEKLVKLARATGRSDKQIVLDLTYLATKEGVASAARKFAPALGMTTAQFKILAGPR